MNKTEQQLNKTVVIIAFMTMAVLMVGGAVVVLLVNPQAIATTVGLVVTVLGLSSTFAFQLYRDGRNREVLDSQSATIDTIQQQTNGNTSAMLSEIARLSTLLAQAPASTASAPKPTQEETS
jgi:uncharacterized membrane protein